MSPETEVLTSDLTQSPTVSPDPLSDAPQISGICSPAQCVKYNLAVTLTFFTYYDFLASQLEMVCKCDILCNIRYLFKIPVLLMTAFLHYRREKREAEKAKT